ncbi:MAG: hypothetical protein Q8K82_09635 [Gemmatimonadaceae bacterium]|nr:hypothetical protein [Gemmatimonadaceae bacterium]
MKTRVLVVSALVLVLSGCSDESILAPSPTAGVSCRPPAELAAMVVGQPFALHDMRNPLEHAAVTMNTALEINADVRALQDFTTLLVDDITASRNDDACRHLTSAYGVLKSLPDTPATLPDRDGIRLIFSLTSQALVAVMGP